MRREWLPDSISCSGRTVSSWQISSSSFLCLHLMENVVGVGGESREDSKRELSKQHSPYPAFARCWVEESE